MTDWYRKENGEIDREKVIDELERDLVREPDEQTFIIGVFDQEAVEGALELLKAQEPKLAKDMLVVGSHLMGKCPKCNKVLNVQDHPVACGFCGQKAKWGL